MTTKIEEQEMKYVHEASTRASTRRTTVVVCDSGTRKAAHGRQAFEMSSKKGGMCGGFGGRDFQR